MSSQRPPAQLISRSGKLPRQAFRLGEETTIGRDPANDVVIEDPHVSKRHARISYQDGRYTLEDLGSTHGTRLDKVLIGGPTPLDLDLPHVIELSEDVELVFTRASIGSSPAGVHWPDQEPREKEAAKRREQLVEEDERAVGESGPDVADLRGTRGTIVDQAGFGTLPQLRESEVEGQRETQAATFDPSKPPLLSERFELAVNLPDEGSASFPLQPGDNIIGRGEDCDITIVDSALWLSRKHAIVRVSEEGVELVDLKGVNGTFVDGKRVDSATLKPGSSFVLGPRLEFTLEAVK